MNDSPLNEVRETNQKMKYVIISGGVVSGLGKGITASSIGLLLKAAGFRVTAIKIDPYLNIDAGTMSPYEHGEVYVLDDGGEADLDLGNYERFLNVTLTRDHNITTGKVYQKVLNTERRGDYLGKTVQMVPHITNAIQDWIERVAQIPVDGTDLTPQICVIELGGTVGDIEGLVFLEAIRQFKFRCGDNLCHAHVSLIPALGNVGELKSKPTQQSMVTLRSTGLSPDIVVLRCSKMVPQNIINKVSMFSMVPKQNIIGVHDVENIYQVPQLLLQQNVLQLIFKKISVDPQLSNVDLTEFNQIANQLTDKKLAVTKEVTIGIVGKYTGLNDAYLSVTKALLSAALECRLRLQVVWIESSDLESDENVEISAKNDSLSPPSKGNTTTMTSSSDNTSPTPELTPEVEETKDIVHNISFYNELSPTKSRRRSSKSRKTEHRNAWNKLKSVDGILIPGGFGDRGIEGKILAVEYARTHKVPFLGICLGMQMAVTEFCRNVLHLEDANSTEFDKDTSNPTVIFMPEGDKEKMGGTMRLGSRQCHLKDGSVAQYLYNGQHTVYERHRHRYEVNPDLVDEIEAKGLIFSGKDEKNERMEIIELAPKNHPFFFGCQFHPEFKSRPLNPSPPFQGLIKASSGILHKESVFQKLFGQIEPEIKRIPKLHFKSSSSIGSGQHQTMDSKQAHVPSKVLEEMDAEEDMGMD